MPIRAIRSNVASARSGQGQRRTLDRYACGVCGFLLVAIGLIYGQTLEHDLLYYDDSGFVFANPHVTPGLTGEGIRWAFTDGPYGEWYPLATLSHMLDCQLYGLNAWGHHLTNVLLHAATSIALFLVLWRMTAERWPSAFVAVVFAVHPQHVESVAWVAERRDVLSGLFFMLTLGAYLGYVRHGRRPARYLLTAALLALGLLAKAMLVTLPPLLLLLDYWPLARIGSASDVSERNRSAERPGLLRLVLEKLPLGAMAAGDCLMTLRTHVQGAQLPWWERVGNAAVACVTYVVQFFNPLNLCAFYPNPVGGHPTWKMAGAIVVLSIVSAGAVIWRRRCPYFFVGWFWYLGMLVPVLGLITVSDHAMADRYMYLPGIGLYIALAWGSVRLAARIPEGPWVLGVCAGLLTVVLVAVAAWQTSFWRNDETLWRRVLACTNENSKAEFSLAEALARQGRREDAMNHYRRAEKGAISSWPFNSLGVLLAEEGKLDEAVDQFRRALEVEPDSLRALVNLAEALARQGRFDEARQRFSRALELDPQSASAHIGLAHLLFIQGKIDEARAELERAVAIDPNNASPRNDLAVTLMRLGKIDAAIEQLNAALAIDPKLLLTRVNLARALAERGRIEEAAEHYRRVLAIDPHNVAAREELDKLRRAPSAPPTP